MIKNRRYKIICDPRDKITSGEKTEEGKPKGLPYFDISSFPELVKAYGEKPEELYLYFPSDNISDIFDDEFNLYGSNNQKKRSCDGEICIHRIPEEINGKTYQAGEESPCICQNLAKNDKHRCKYVAYLKAWIALPETGKIENPLCYLFRTRSKNSGDNIYTELEKIKTLAGGCLRGIKFQISVRMVANKEDAKKRFPIWSLQSVGMVSEIRQEAIRWVKNTSEIPMIEMEKQPVVIVKPEEAIEKPLVKVETYVTNANPDTQVRTLIKANPAQKEEKSAQRNKIDYVSDIKRVLKDIYTGELIDDAENESKLLMKLFGSSKWSEIVKLPIEKLQAGLQTIEKELNDEELPF